MAHLTNIRVSVVDQTLKIVDAPVVASGGKNEVRVVFDFCEKWDGLEKTAIFYVDESDPYYSICDAEDTCIVPWEVYAEKGTFYFGVFGENGDIVKTSFMARYRVRDGALFANMRPSDPTPDIYSQIMEKLAQIQSNAPSGGITTEQIKDAMEEYFEENPIESTTSGEYYRPEVSLSVNGDALVFKFMGSSSDLPDLPPQVIKLPVADLSGYVRTVNGIAPDETGNVQITIPDGSGNVPRVTVEPADDDIPKVFFGGALQQTKTEKVVPFSYRSRTLRLDCYAEIKAQGNSTLSWPKKNQTVKLYEDAACTKKLKVDFKGWGKQNKFVIKANWRDLTHVRDIVSVRLEADCMRTNPDYAELPELLRTSPNLGGVDGFPVVVYAAGIYQGRYMWNIPKDAWMANMDDDLAEHCILCSEDYNSSCFRAAANIGGNDWTDEIHKTVPASIKTRWNEVISFVRNSSDEEFIANLDSYIKVSTLIDRHIMGLLSCDYDGYGKNQLYITYDGQQWYVGRYDKDGTWGNFWNGDSMLPSSYGRNQYEDMVSGRPGNLLFIRLEQLFFERLQTRWAELKDGALSIPNIINRFRELYDITPPHLIAEDYANTTANGAFTGIPNKNTCTIQQIQKFIVERHAWMDEYVAGLTPDIAVPCEGITLDESYMTFTENGTQTLTATVIPEGCTDSVVWESDNIGVATVDNGVVTAIANGNAIITARCGNHSATCSVAVSGIAEPVPCTGIVLDKNELAFTGNGTQTITATVTPIDTTDPVVWVSSNPYVASIVVDGNVCTVRAISNGSATITATCGEYAENCVVTVAGVETNNPLYPFVNGTVKLTDNSGSKVGTLTVSDGNHINAIRNYGWLCINIGMTAELPEAATKGANKTNIENLSNALFSLKAGDVVTTNLKYTESNAHAGKTAVFVVKAGGTETMNFYPDTAGDISYTLTVEYDFDVGGIGFYATQEATTLDCDIELYVNGVRYV